MLRVWLKYYWGDQMIRIHLSRLLGERRWTQIQLSRATGIRAATINEIYNELVDRVNLEHLKKLGMTLSSKNTETVVNNHDNR